MCYIDATFYSSLALEHLTKKYMDNQASKEKDKENIEDLVKYS